jgi:hypothetical protein
VHFDPYAHDPDHWGFSLSQSAELILAAFDAAQVRSVVEVGALFGDLTDVLVQWAAARGATVGAVDPSPRETLVALAEAHPELELLRETSLEVLPRIPLPDAVILDGDHNWWTVSEELRLISERAPGAELPLLVLHDVAWPHGRRDDYFAPELIPAEARHPLVGEGRGIIPGDSGAHEGRGLPYPKSARHEGGPRNGVLTAVEDFVAARPDARLAVLPVFFGVGFVWSREAPYAEAVEQALAPWDRHPVLERLEENRLFFLAEQHLRLQEIWMMRERLKRQEALLQRVSRSRAFAVAERLSSLRRRAGIGREHTALSREDVQRALSGDARDAGG